MKFIQTTDNISITYRTKLDFIKRLLLTLRLINVRPKKDKLQDHKSFLERSLSYS